MLNAEAPSTYMQRNSFPLEENPTAERGIKAGASSSVRNDVTTEPSDRTSNLLFWELLLLLSSLLLLSISLYLIE